MNELHPRVEALDHTIDHLWKRLLLNPSHRPEQLTEISRVTGTLLWGNRVLKWPSSGGTGLQGNPPLGEPSSGGTGLQGNPPLGEPGPEVTLFWGNQVLFLLFLSLETSSLEELQLSSGFIWADTLKHRYYWSVGSCRPHPKGLWGTFTWSPTSLFSPDPLTPAGPQAETVRIDPEPAETSPPWTWGQTGCSRTRDSGRDTTSLDHRGHQSQLHS